MNILDEYSRECLAIRVKRKLNSTDVMDVLTDLFKALGIKQDNPAWDRPRDGNGRFQNMTYPSQRESPVDRAFRRAD